MQSKTYRKNQWFLYRKPRRGLYHIHVVNISHLRSKYIERSVPVRMYNYGSEAREIEYSTETMADNTVKLSKKDKMEAYVNARIEEFKKKAIKTLVIIAAILAVVMIREARIDQLCGQISNIEDDIYSLNAMITEREMHLSYQLDMNNIDEIAISRLGMKKPDASQYIYIDVQKNVGGEILMKDRAGNGFSAFMNKAKILLEYLY